MEDKIDKRTREYKDRVGATLEGLEPIPHIDDVIDYSLRENNPGFTKCCKVKKEEGKVVWSCGADLEPNDDGSPKFRNFGVACQACVKRDYSKAIINGKKVDIDPAHPPKTHYVTDRTGIERVVYK